MMAKAKKGSLTPQQCQAALDRCACSNLRMATRAVTRLFDEALEPSGLRATQLVILLAILARESSTVSRLSRELLMDPSTLHRNLGPLSKQGLIRSQPAGEGRRLNLSTTAKGRAAVQKAVPLWQETQRRLEARVGARQFDQMLANIKHIATVADDE